MSLASLFLTLALVHLAALVAPGPDFALMLRSSLNQGRAQALQMALGLASAIMVHSLVVVFAFALLAKVLPGLLHWLPLVAGCWLLYLAAQCLKSARAPQGAIDTQSAPAGGAWLAGFATNILNPKAYLYFFTLVGGLLPPALSLAAKLGVVALFFSLALAWFGMLGWLLGAPWFRQKMLGWRRGIEGATALVFAAVGVLMLLRLA